MVARMSPSRPHRDIDLESFVDGLSPAQKSELRALLNYEAASTQHQFSVWEKSCYEAMVEVSSKGAVGYAPLDIFAKQQGIDKFCTACFGLEKFIADNCALVMRLPKRVAIMRVLVKALSDYLVSIDVPPTPKTLLNNMHLAGWAVDKQFPGYVSNKLLDMLATPNQR